MDVNIMLENVNKNKLSGISVLFCILLFASCNTSKRLQENIYKNVSSLLPSESFLTMYSGKNELLLRVENPITRTVYFPYPDFDRKCWYETEDREEPFFIRIRFKGKHYSEKQYINDNYRWRRKLMHNNPKAIISNREYIRLNDCSIIIEDSFHGLQPLYDLYFIKKEKDKQLVRDMLSAVVQSFQEHDQLYEWKKNRLKKLCDVPEEIKQRIRHMSAPKE